MSFGAGLVVLGMVLNSLLGDADAQLSRSGEQDASFRMISCEGLVIKDGFDPKGYFGLIGGNAILQIPGDDGITPVAYLGANTSYWGPEYTDTRSKDGEIMFRLNSKSKTDKRGATMSIDTNGGRFDGDNKLGENVVRLVVHGDGSGLLDLRDKNGYKK